MADRGKKKKGIKCNGVQVSLIEEHLTVIGYEKTMVIKGGRKQRFHIFLWSSKKKFDQKLMLLVYWDIYLTKWSWKRE